MLRPLPAARSCTSHPPAARCPQLATRLCQYLRPKIHPLLLDATINSPHTVRLNIYQVGGWGGLVVGNAAGDARRCRCWWQPGGSLAVCWCALCQRALDGRGALERRPAGCRPRRLLIQPRPGCALLSTVSALRTLPSRQAFLLGAMKLHCYVRALPAAPPPGASLLLDAILQGGEGWLAGWRRGAAARGCRAAAERSRLPGRVASGLAPTPTQPKGNRLPTPAGISFMCGLTHRRRVASAHLAGLEVACATRLPPAHVRCGGQGARSVGGAWRGARRSNCQWAGLQTGSCRDSAHRRPACLHHHHPYPCPRWLGLTAFARVLRRKQARYRQLLAALEELAAAPGLAGVARQLAPVVDPARSSAFDAILY